MTSPLTLTTLALIFILLGFSTHAHTHTHKHMCSSALLLIVLALPFDLLLAGMREWAQAKSKRHCNRNNNNNTATSTAQQASLLSLALSPPLSCCLLAFRTQHFYLLPRIVRACVCVCVGLFVRFCVGFYSCAGSTVATRRRSCRQFINVINSMGHGTWDMGSGADRSFLCILAASL